MSSLSRGRFATLSIGVALVLFVIFSEILSTSPNGIGPYQGIILLFAILIIVIGIIGAEGKFSKVTFILLSFVVSIMLIEGALLILSRASVVVTYPEVRELLDDDVLGKRTPANAVGHDARGWRNSFALKQSDIVTIGDSQTWGVNATLAEAYPSVLSRLTNYSVYSMAQGSYGAVQYRVLTEQAIELSPQLIVIGLYFGNDFADTYNIVYGDYVHQNLRNPSFDLTSVTQTIAEQAASFQPSQLDNTNQLSSQKALQSFGDRLRSGTYIGRFLTNFGILDRVNTGEIEEHLVINRAKVAEYPELFAIYDQENVLTFLTPAYRYLVVNTESPAIAEGVRISKLQFGEIKAMLQSLEIELLVVLIPTKEFVYLPYIEPELNRYYRQLGEQEYLIREEMIEFFQANDIAYLDIVPGFQNAVENNIAIYPESFDGHPNSNGYRIIAEQVAEYLEDNDIMK